MKTRSVSTVKDEIKVPTPIEFHKVNSRPDESEMNDDLIGHCYYCDGKISIWTEKGWSEFGGEENGVYVAYFDEFATDTYDTIQAFFNDDKKSQFYIEYKNWLIPASVDGENYIVSAYFQEDNTIQEMRCECTGGGWTMLPVITDGSIKTKHLAKGAVTKTKIATGAHNPYVVLFSTTRMQMAEDCYNAIKNTTANTAFPDVIITYNNNNNIFRKTTYNSGNLKTIDFGDADNYIRVTFESDGSRYYTCDTNISDGNFLKRKGGEMTGTLYMIEEGNTGYSNSLVFNGTGDTFSTDVTMWSEGECEQRGSFHIQVDADNKTLDANFHVSDDGDSFLSLNDTKVITENGGDIKGALTVLEPTADMNPATKKYVDNAVIRYIPEIVLNGDADLATTGDIPHDIITGEVLQSTLDAEIAKSTIRYSVWTYDDTDDTKNNITISVSDSYNEMCYIFDCGANSFNRIPSSVTLSPNLIWLNGDSFDITKMSTGKTYMVSVCKNLACWGEFS